MKRTHSLNEFEATQTQTLRPKVSSVCAPGTKIKVAHRSAENSSRAPFLGVTLLDNEIAEL